MDIIAITDTNNQCGAIVWWALTGSVNINNLRCRIEEFGSEIPEPKPAGEAAILRRAIEKVCDKKSLLVRPLKSRGNFMIVGEFPEGNERLTHRNLLRCWVENGEILFDDADESYDTGGLRLRILDSYEEQKESLQPSEIGGWLTEVASFYGAVSLRQRGGVYFVPRQNLENWKNAVELLHKTSQHSVHEVPAMQTQEAVEAILASLSRETESEMKQFEEELCQESLGKRALSNRVQKCTNLRHKVQSYAELLGQNLDVLQERLFNLEGQLAAAALATMNTNEG